MGIVMSKVNKSTGLGLYVLSAFLFVCCGTCVAIAMGVDWKSFFTGEGDGMLIVAALIAALVLLGTGILAFSVDRRDAYVLSAVGGALCFASSGFFLGNIFVFLEGMQKYQEAWLLLALSLLCFAVPFLMRGRELGE